MKSVKLYNNLDGKKVSREELKQILDVAIADGNQFVYDKLFNILMKNKEDFFEINLITFAKESGLGKPMPKVGIAKIALDECGRLRKGFKFLNGKIVKVEVKTKAKVKKTTTRKPSTKTRTRKVVKNPLLDKVLALKEKYVEKAGLKITTGLNGVVLADGHMVADGKEINFDNDHNDAILGLNFASQDVEEYINNLILERINTGEDLPPWKQSWAKFTSVLAQNFNTKVPYQGSNAVILNVLLGSIMPTPYYLTPNQIADKKGNIKKGAKTIPLIYYNFVYNLKNFKNNPAEESKLLAIVNGFQVKRKDKKTITLNQSNYYSVFLTDSEIKELGVEYSQYISRAFLKYFRVINIADTEGIPYTLPEPQNFTEKEKIAKAERIVEMFLDKPKIENVGDEAVFKVKEDLIQLPKMKFFDNSEEYYSTLFHELIHSTMVKSRLNREEDYVGKDKDASYAFEELIAELGASYLCGLCGIIDVVYMNSASYLKSWHERLQEYTKTNSNFFIYATKEAQKAVDYILKNYTEEENQEPKNDDAKAKAMAAAEAEALLLLLKLKNRK